MRGTIAAVGLLGLLAACGSETPHTLPPKDDRVPITQRAIAAIMLGHLPGDTTTREAMYTDDTDRPGTLGADLRYGGGGETDGELVRAVVVPGQRELPCAERCVELDTGVEGATLTLHWDEEMPEEDPGIVAVALQRADEYAYVYQSGPTITKDPRELDLAVSVEDMVEVAEDPWLRLETSPEAIGAGERLDDWEGGEPDPHAYDRVPNTDLGMIAAYQGLGFGGAFTDYGVSPLKAELGPGAIGGRMTRKGGAGDDPGVVWAATRRA